jgi:hypothetical protein
VGALAAAPEAITSRRAFVLAAVHQLDLLDVIPFALLQKERVYDRTPPLLYVPNPVFMNELL